MGSRGHPPPSRLGPRKSTNRPLPCCSPPSSLVPARRPSSGSYTKTSSGVCRQLLARRPACNARHSFVSASRNRGVFLSPSSRVIRKLSNPWCIPWCICEVPFWSTGRNRSPSRSLHFSFFSFSKENFG